MVKAKIAGVAIGGLAGYLILRHGLNVIQNSVAYITDAAKWKAYYKYGNDVGKDGICCTVPPGYTSCTRDINKDQELVVEDPSQKKAESGENTDASKRTYAADLVESVCKAINKWIDSKEAVKGAKEGQREASERDISCPQNCDVCTIEKCPFAELKRDGKITKWDENGNPIAGRYSLEKSNKTELKWFVEKVQGEYIFDKAPGDPEPLYHDDLYDGVSVEFPDTDAEKETEV